MLEITIDNRNKCDLETIIVPNNSQYFWINRRDLEIETKRNWQVIFDKYKQSSTQKYRKELTPNINRKNNVVKDAEIKESTEKPKEIKSPEEDKYTADSYPNWFDKNTFKNILAIIDCNKFNCRHKIGEFRYIKI